MNKSITFLAVSLLFVSASNANDTWTNFKTGAKNGATEFGTNFVGALPTGAGFAIAQKLAPHLARQLPVTNQEAAGKIILAAATFELVQRSERTTACTKELINARTHTSNFAHVMAVAGKATGAFAGQHYTNSFLVYIKQYLNKNQ